MIEKLEKHIIGENAPGTIPLMVAPIAERQVDKINELIDKVNDLTTNLDGQARTLIEQQYKIAILEEHAHPTATTEPTDPYAEQRKWIGCVCRFWYDNPDDTALDYLGKIQTGENGIEYYGKETYDWFPHCEPVLPTDNAIYKGE